MLEQLDRLMQQRGLAWIIALGAPAESADVYYLLQGARVGHALVLKRQGEPPLAIVHPMEREEARRAGLRWATPAEYGAAAIQALGLPAHQTAARLMLAVLERHQVRGPVSFAGHGPVAATFARLRAVLAERPELEHVLEEPPSVLQRARMVKSEEEVARIRAVGRRTEEVVRLVVRMLASCERRDGVLVRPGGEPLKVGHVKEYIAVELIRRGLDDHGQTIVAPGREGGFPHSRGVESEPVPADTPIVLDIFPQERGGGYYFDMTRTLWFGEPGERARACLAAVEHAFAAGLGAIRPGVLAAEPDEAASAVLERHGHPTRRQQPDTVTGYMHSLGHGVGLELHEHPMLSARPGNTDRLEPGAVFTVEPGLYYPEEGFGIRVEDTLWLRPDGELENLTTLPHEPEALLAEVR
ncbi:MAG: hypothetical protein KatS3mg102_0419 [Planctomycetota bacterium]|nr:MAG: hypothetical protein KatS3mg102_0419 [Planctomycetota bacterium]